MRRATLAGLPPVQLPPGYSLRHWRPGDSAAWDAIYGAAFGNANPAGFFQRSLRVDGPFRPERVFFVCKGGIPVATASAWRSFKYGAAAGYLHYVAVLPSEGGKGLGLAASLAALHKMAEEGRAWAALQTDDHRLAAITQYLKLDFEPLPVAENQRARWRAIFTALAKPELSVRFAKLLDGPLYDLAADAPDLDRADRYAPRRKWLPARPHQGGIGGGDMDFMSDESLYRPSRLGTARVEPSDVTAGAPVERLRLTFTAGPDGLAAGARVAFEMRGQSPLGFPLSFGGGEPGTCRLNGPDGVELEPANVFAPGWILRQGFLAEGQSVTAELVPKEGQTWKPVAGVREFKVAIYTAGDEPGRRLPEPVRLTIRPAAPDHLDVLLPSTAAPGAPLEAVVTLRDRWDNRCPLDRPVTLRAPGLPPAAGLLSDGRACIKIGNMPDGPVRAEAAAEGLPLPSREGLCAPSADGLQLFVGDLHCHDLLSQAEGWPDAVYRWAIEDKRLDFLVLSPQSHGWHDNETWTLAKYMNERVLDEGRFVSLLGYEWQHTGYGDKVVISLGGDQPVLPVDDGRYSSAAKLYEALRASDAIAVAHHSAYPPGSWCSHTRFDAVEDDVERLVELWSMHGSSEGYDPGDRPLLKRDPEGTAYTALRRGLKLGFVGGSDSHSGRPGGSAREPLPYWGGLTAVWAPRLSRRDLFEALRERRTYALTGSRIVMRMTVNGAPMGSILPASPSAALRVEAWAPTPIRRVEILKNTLPLHACAPADTRCVVEFSDTPGGPVFYHARITLENGHLAVCSPVWIG
jgi:mycothiol synthase